MLFSAFKGTILHNALLPILDIEYWKHCLLKAIEIPAALGALKKKVKRSIFSLNTAQTKSAYLFGASISREQKRTYKDKS